MDFDKFKNSPKFNKENYIFGTENEKKKLGIFRVYFNDDDIKQLPEGSYFDYEGDTCLIELKTRRCSVFTYFDTAITTHKIVQSALQEKPVYFVFDFTDGLFFYRYNPRHKLRQYEIKGVSHHFIPRAYLTKININ